MTPHERFDIPARGDAVAEILDHLDVSIDVFADRKSVV
jgi:hypothetical protein